jgi:hypothetical protein
VKENFDGSYKFFIIDFGRGIQMNKLASLKSSYRSELLKNAQSAAEYHFKDENLFVSSFFRGISINPNYSLEQKNFSVDLVKKTILLLLSMEYSYYETTFQRQDVSNMSKYFINNINGYASFVKITNSLNVYYNLSNFSGYKRLSEKENYDRSMEDVQSFLTCVRKPPDAQVELLEPFDPVQIEHQEEPGPEELRPEDLDFFIEEEDIGNAIKPQQRKPEPQQTRKRPEWKPRGYRMSAIRNMFGNRKVVPAPRKDEPPSGGSKKQHRRNKMKKTKKVRRACF